MPDTSPAPSSDARYDDIGRGYRTRRRPDPRWESAIHAAIGNAGTVLNVGAGTGSYEPTDRPVIALEPSRVMIGQRAPTTAPVVQGVAGALPFADGTFDTALAVLTVHHWPDPALGLAELQRVSRRQVVVTWDAEVASERMWFLADYLPVIGEREAGLATLRTIQQLLGDTTTHPLPVPFDCTDGFFGAYWRRPEAFLDPDVRRSISALALLDEPTVQAAVTRLRADLHSGRWHDRHQDLLTRTDLDLGYRIVVADSRGQTPTLVG